LKEGSLYFWEGAYEVALDVDGNVYLSGWGDAPEAVDEAAKLFWRVLADAHTPYIGSITPLIFSAEAKADFALDGTLSLSYRPNALTKRFWEAVVRHWPDCSQTVAPKPVFYAKGFEGDECCPVYDAGYACPCPPTEPSPKPFDWDHYNGIKR
jgi:hypothetical protein